MLDATNTKCSYRKAKRITKWSLGWAVSLVAMLPCCSWVLINPTVLLLHREPQHAGCSRAGNAILHPGFTWKTGSKSHYDFATWLTNGKIRGCFSNQHGNIALAISLSAWHEDTKDYMKAERALSLKGKQNRKGHQEKREDAYETIHIVRNLRHVTYADHHLSPSKQKLRVVLWTSFLYKLPPLWRFTTALQNFSTETGHGTYLFQISFNTNFNVLRFANKICQNDRYQVLVIRAILLWPTIVAGEERKMKQNLLGILSPAFSVL